MSKRRVNSILLLLCVAVFPSFAQTAHEGALNDIAWNPVVGEFASCGDDGTIIVWDAETYEPKRSFQAHEDYALCLAYNRDGSLLVSGGADYSVILWDTESYEAIRIFTGHTDYVRSVAFHPEGGTLASAGDDGMVFLWDIETGNVFAEFTGHVDYVRSVAFGPDGTHLASGSDDTTVILWNLETKRQERVFRHHDDYVRTVTFSPRGDLLASAGDDSLINIINLNTGRRIHSFRAHDDYVRDIVFSPDGEKLLSAGDDGRVRMWDYRQEKLLDEHAEHGGYVYSVSTDPTGTFVVSGGDNGSLYVYDLAAREVVFEASGAPERSAEEGEEPQDFMCAAFHPREDVIAAGTIGGMIYIYDSAAGELLEEMEGGGEAVYLLKFSSDGRYLISTGSEYRVTVWDYPSLTKAAVLDGFTDYVWAVDVTSDNGYLLCGDASGIVHQFSMNDFSSQNRFQAYQSAVTDIDARPGSNRFATSSESGRVDVWGLTDGERYKSLGTPHASMITGIEYSSDGRYLITAELNGKCSVWQAETYYEVTSEYIHDDSIYSLGAGFDGTEDFIVTGGESPAVRVVRIPELEEITRTAEVESPVTNVAVSAAGTHLLGVSEVGTVTILKTATGAALYALAAPDGGYPGEGELFEEDFMVLTVAASGNDRYLAAGGSDGVVRLWDYRTGSLLAVLEGHTDYVRSVAFSPDNRLLASGSDDGTVKLWDVEDLRLLRTLRGHTDYVRSVVFADDGSVLISGSDDGTVRVWDMETYDTIRIIEAHEGYVLSVDTLNAAENVLSGGEDGKIHVWNRDGKLLKTLEYTGSTD